MLHLSQGSFRAKLAGSEVTIEAVGAATDASGSVTIVQFPTEAGRVTGR